MDRDDTITIYDGLSLDAPIIASGISGHHVPNIQYNSTANQMMVKFETDDDYVELGDFGFLAFFKEIVHL